MKSDYDEKQEQIRSLKLPGIEVWENKYPEREYTVRLEIPEFTCVCPKTGLPDFACISIDYVPREWCVELKSFKLYLVAYRDVGIFHEHLVNRVLDDFVKACRPRRADIKIVMNPRGGIATTVEARYLSNKKEVVSKVI